jgi:hypothetical protein
LNEVVSQLTDEQALALTDRDAVSVDDEEPHHNRYRTATDENLGRGLADAVSDVLRHSQAALAASDSRLNDNEEPHQEVPAAASSQDPFFTNDAQEILRRKVEGVNW